MDWVQFMFVMVEEGDGLFHRYPTVWLVWPNRSPIFSDEHGIGGQVGKIV